ncbi:MAG: GntR family transcriptional regulator [Gemmataceae bacterium]|nr:GntR family transcriptional regulator [Gemmataceae bacterium]
MIEVSQLYHQVYKHLVNEILAGRLPPGRILRETILAAQLKVSRTPIREALRKLAADGLVEISPNRSAVVRRLGAEQLGHIYQVREALEGMATELACGHLTAADFTSLDRLATAAEDAAQPNYRTACHRFDVELHRLVASRAGNPILAKEIEKFHDLVQLVRERTASYNEMLALAYRQHLEIIAALKAGDGAAARKAMIEHIRSSCEVALRHGVDPPPALDAVIGESPRKNRVEPE